MAFNNHNTTGGELPPLNGNSSVGNSSGGNNMSLKQFVQSQIDSGKWNGTSGPASIFAFLAGKGGGFGGDSATQGTATTKGKTTPKTPPPQWTFKPNPYNESPYVPGGPGPGPAAQYNIPFNQQPWMLNPMGQQPQQPTPQEQQGLQYYQQWAPPYRTGQ